MPGFFFFQNQFRENLRILSQQRSHWKLFMNSDVRGRLENLNLESDILSLFKVIFQILYGVFLGKKSEMFQTIWVFWQHQQFFMEKILLG